jgi:hypothetical protein
MTSIAPQQRSAAAADMLTGARNKGDGGKGLPPDRLIDQFETGLETVCTADATMSLADVGAGLYLTDRHASARDRHQSTACASHSLDRGLSRCPDHR